MARRGMAALAALLTLGLALPAQGQTLTEDETVQQFFSPGAHYLITPDLEIGVRVGWGLNREAPNFFSNAGLGWRY